MDDAAAKVRGEAILLRNFFQGDYYIFVNCSQECFCLKTNRFVTMNCFIKCLQKTILNAKVIDRYELFFKKTTLFLLLVSLTTYGCCFGQTRLVSQTMSSTLKRHPVNETNIFLFKKEKLKRGQNMKRGL